MFETYLTVVGRVITEINRRTLPSGVPVCSFRLAANERRYNKESQEWVDGDRVYISVTCWRRLAEGVAASLVKGDNVIVTGRLYVREFESEGQPRSMMEIDARAVGPDLSMYTATLQRSNWNREGAARSNEDLTPSIAAA